MIQIRAFNAEDAKETYELFYNTVHNINARDYSKEQLDTWAPKDKNIDEWCASLLKNYSFVAVDTHTHQIVGFADLDAQGYLDRGYVHHDYQRQGVGQLLLNACEQKAQDLGIKTIYSDVSITAKPFLEHNHFAVIKEQVKELNGVQFIQYHMEKKLK